MATRKTTTATVAAEQPSVANHVNEDVTVTNSGDQPAAGTLEIAVDLGNQLANVAPATEIDTSGAPQQIVDDVDLSHPAVDANPRANTTVAQNRIDFNDPSLDSSEAVAKMLREQGVEITTEPSKQ